MGNAACNVMKSSVSVFFEYDTSKLVQIKSKSIGILNRLVQLVIIGYIIGWVLIYSQGYQLKDVGISGTTTKVKGVAYTNDSQVGERIWDVADVVIPPEENDAFFVMTNMIVTEDQSQGECPESSAVANAQCKNDSDCQPIGKAFLLGHGVSTGTCNVTTHTCMVKAWCPLEIDETPANGSYALLNATKDFTLLLKNHVYFPYYTTTRSNILEQTNKSYLQGCTYDSVNNQLCPIFKLGYIADSALKKSGSSQTYDEMAIEGGVISIRIKWDCNFDHNPKLCTPTYEFDRLDGGTDSRIAKGYNFRYSNNYVTNGTERRQLLKSYGILFIITVDATARKFNVIPTLQNIGSGVALLAVATVLCDIFVLYFHTKKQFFRKHKYEEVQTSDAYNVLQ